MSDLVKGFIERTQDAQTLINIVRENLWEDALVKSRLLHVPYGYETHIPPEVREKLRRSYNETARYIRFAPDFFVLDLENLDNLYLLEYKCTRTPLYSTQRISSLQAQARMKELTSEDVGQWEASAYDNYQALQSIGVRVAILNYCAYHPRHLLCDFVEKAQVLNRSEVQTETLTGSRTPFVNPYLRALRTLAEFLVGEHSLEEQLATHVRLLCESVEQKLLEALPEIRT